MSPTTHGAKRIAQRLGLPSNAVERQAANAYARGVKRVKIRGPLRKYLDWLLAKGLYLQAATDIRVYNDHIYLFAGETLVTAWPMPLQFMEEKNGQEQRLSDHPQDATVSPQSYGGGATASSS